jgi:hypothetical protein
MTNMNGLNDLRVAQPSRNGSSIVSTRVLSLVATALLTAATSVCAETQVGLVSNLRGRVTVVRRSRSITPEMGTAIDEHDQITTGAGRVTITFPDRSRVQLGGNSAVVIQQQLEQAAQAPSTKLELLAGIVRTTQEQTNTRRQFEVSTANAVVVALGGKTDTSYYPNYRRRGFDKCVQFTDVAVLDGEAEFSKSASQTRTHLPAGYVSTVACDGNPLSPGPLGVTDVQTLNEDRSGYFSFISSFFQGGSPNVEKQDIDGIVQDRHDAEDPPEPSITSQSSTRAVLSAAPANHGPVRVPRFLRPR